MWLRSCTARFFRGEITDVETRFIQAPPPPPNNNISGLVTMLDRGAERTSVKPRAGHLALSISGMFYATHYGRRSELWRSSRQRPVSPRAAPENVLLALV